VTRIDISPQIRLYVYRTKLYDMDDVIYVAKGATLPLISREDRNKEASVPPISRENRRFVRGYDLEPLHILPRRKFMRKSYIRGLYMGKDTMKAS
jgi:hypothetical protein